MKKKRTFRAFTLIEILIVVGAIAVVGSAGYVVATNVQENARESKLETDMAAVNSALQLYKANGGQIAADDTAQEVVQKLQQSANQSTGAKSTGLKGSFLDTRVKPIPLEDANSSQLRVVWNAEQGRFMLAREGQDAIQRFDLDDASAAAGPSATNERKNNLEVATVDKWIWDYEDKEVANAAPAPTPPVNARPDYTDPVASNRSKLAMPEVVDTNPGKTLDKFDKSITLSNPNIPGISQIYYRTGTNYRNGATGTPTLYEGQQITIKPDGVVEAYADSIDPDRWDDSDNEEEPFDFTKATLSPAINVPATLTYAQAGGAMASGGVQAVPNATISMAAVGGAYFNSTNIRVTYTGLNVSGTANSFNGSFPSITVPLGPPDVWTASTGTVSVLAQSTGTDPAYFNQGSASQTISIAPTALSLTFATPPGSLSATDKIIIQPANSASFPSGYEIRYTTDGSQPDRSKTLYPTGGLSLPSGSTDITIRAKPFPSTSSLDKWFTLNTGSSGPYTVPVAGSALPGGVLVSFAELQNNVQINGSMIVAYSGTGTPSNMTFFGNSRVKGNVYVPGTPEVYKDHIAESQWDYQKWTGTTDGNFANYILGKQFDGNGNEIIPQTEPVSPRVVNLNGNQNPTGYTILIQDSAKIEGKLYRRSTHLTMPVVTMTGTKSNNTSRDYHSWTLSPQNPSRYPTTVDPSVNSGVNLTTSATLTLQAGNYSNVTASGNGAQLVIGDAANPNNVKYYTFENLVVNGGAGIKVVGKVVVTINNASGNGTMRIDNNGYFGSVEKNSQGQDDLINGFGQHPEYLQLNVYTPPNVAASQYQTHVLVASSGKLAGQVNAPKGQVTIQEGATFFGSVTAYKLLMTGNAGVDVTKIKFNLPPVTG